MATVSPAAPVRAGADAPREFETAGVGTRAVGEDERERLGGAVGLLDRLPSLVRRGGFDHGGAMGFENLARGGATRRVAIHEQHPHSAKVDPRGRVGCARRHAEAAVK